LDNLQTERPAFPPNAAFAAQANPTGGQVAPSNFENGVIVVVFVSRSAPDHRNVST
jgi:hypothetical protein